MKRLLLPSGLPVTSTMQKPKRDAHSFPLLWFRLFFILAENPVSVGILAAIANKRLFGSSFSVLFFPLVFVEVSLYSVFHKQLLPLFDWFFGVNEAEQTPEERQSAVSHRLQRQKEMAGIWSTSFSSDSVLRVVWQWIHSLNRSLCAIPDAAYLALLLLAEFILHFQNTIRGVTVIVGICVVLCYTVVLLNISLFIAPASFTPTPCISVVCISFFRSFDGFTSFHTPPTRSSTFSCFSIKLPSVCSLLLTHSQTISFSTALTFCSTLSTPSLASTFSSISLSGCIVCLFASLHRSLCAAVEFPGHGVLTCHHE